MVRPIEDVAINAITMQINAKKNSCPLLAFSSNCKNVIVLQIRKPAS